MDRIGSTKIARKLIGNMKTCEHHPGHWEINPKTGVMTRRCPICGHIHETKQKKVEEI